MTTRRKPLPPADAADALTGLHLNAFLVRNICGRKVWAVDDSCRVEERKSPPLWTPETDAEASEPFWIPEGKPWPTHRYSATWVPPFSTQVGTAWGLVELLHRRGDCLSLIYCADYSKGPEGMSYVANFRIAEVRAVADTPELAICRAAWKAWRWWQEQKDV